MYIKSEGDRKPRAAPPEPTRRRLSIILTAADMEPAPTAEQSAEKSLWIFGYGSLVWKPDFQFTSSKVGFIQGYSRKFWQGDTFHRGNERMPGRVVTLQEDYDCCTWGIAYEVCGEQIELSLQYLNVRESVLGGYATKIVNFYPQDEGPSGTIMALVYIATPQNPSYLGPASEEDIAAQIIVSSGCSGHNIEYLLRLADFMRFFCPEAEDKHLFQIEEALIAILPCFYSPDDPLAVLC
ncbi:glutathione-specific gamma-glutamylcyclotransferase 1 [Microcaecilia unicolor]|uniref:Gamma-glutamylcyclotransferase n=1 Tax=Microcaecilia unicolor TaxID=1415580 RepID=A0A6P7YVS0_9AMPH|nr:glutathione-specific gamma-glutamylcyclotransferase 1 [Microcaecilia unicolor]